MGKNGEIGRLANLNGPRRDHDLVELSLCWRPENPNTVEETVCYWCFKGLLKWCHF